MNSSIFNYDGHGYQVVFDWKSQSLVAMELGLKSFDDAFNGNDYKVVHCSRSGCIGGIKINDPFRIAENVNIISVRTDVSLTYMLDTVSNLEIKSDTVIIVPIASHQDLQISEKYPVWIIKNFDNIHTRKIFALNTNNYEIGYFIKNDFKIDDYKLIRMGLSIINKNNEDYIGDLLSVITDENPSETNMRYALQEAFPETYPIFDKMQDQFDLKLFIDPTLNVSTYSISRKWKWVLMKILDPKGFENCKKWIHDDTDKDTVVYPHLNIKININGDYDFYQESYLNIRPFNMDEFTEMRFYNHQVLIVKPEYIVTIFKNENGDYIYMIHWNVTKLDKLSKYINKDLKLEYNEEDKYFYTYEIELYYPLHYNPNGDFENLVKDLKRGLIKKILKNSEVFNIDPTSLSDDVVISVNDSLAAGNCKPGTESFCKEYGLDIEKSYTLGELKKHPKWDEMFKNYSFRNVLKAVWLREQKINV